MGSNKGDRYERQSDSRPTAGFWKHGNLESALLVETLTITETGHSAALSVASLNRRIVPEGRGLKNVARKGFSVPNQKV